ncbi:MAG: MFS transporter [Pseudomonadota bacterium]|nr:MFS transporter [Pseudomonadota bacterium]
MTPALTANIAFQSPAFRRFQVVRVLGILGLQMQAVAVGWQVYDLTNRPLDLGMVGLVQFIPAMLLWPLTGAVVDRFDRRIIVMATLLGYAITAGLLATFATVGVTSVWPIYGTLLLLAVARSFSAPAHQALLPQLVPREHFPNAVTWSSSLFQLSAIAGPAIGGAVYAITGGARGVYLVAMVLVLAAAAVLTTVRPREAALSRERPSWSQVFEGVRYIRDRPIILGAISLDLFAVLLGGAVALLPIFAKDILAVGPAGLGILRAAPAVGAAAMAIRLAFRPIRGGAGVKLFTSVAVFGLATLAFGASTSFWVSVAALVLVGASDEMSVVIRQTIVQIATPDDKRGRVSAVNFLFIGVSNEIGELESGVTAHWLGARRAVLLGGCGTLLVVAVASWLSPKLRRVDRLEDV